MRRWTLTGRDFRMGHGHFRAEGPELAERESVEVVPLSEVKEALPDPEKLRLLADWFDKEQAEGRWGGGEDVQGDLRRWADSIAGFLSDSEEGKP